MKDSKLIIVTGISGAGKSTTSQKLAYQYEQNGIKHRWLHEEIKAHPIRDKEFSIASIDSEEDMDKNVSYMYSLWGKLADDIEKSDDVFIMEGCLYQNIIRYFFNCNYSIEKITKFYDTVMEIISKLNPTIVFLYRSELRDSFRTAFEVRGERWKNIILNAEGEGYFNEHEYKGDDSVYNMWENYQEIADTMFRRYQGNKIKINTSNELWEKYMKDLMEYLGLEYNYEKVIVPEFLQQYCGRYSVTIDDRQHELKIKLDESKENIYCEVFFFKNIKLIPLGNHEFLLMSFPIKLSFKTHNGKKAVQVTGIYDWSIMGKLMLEI
ncbi:hypothetical protein KHQ81_12660 [Mycoplasmatota bacterium]|nr:hypothetical protein KHQ81_12660 [Mycoplasmatota bacterium]